MNAIYLHNIYYAYPDSPDKAVLNIPNWSVLSGEQVFVHGPSGCGKSTLLNVLSGMLTPARGEVSILGERLDQLSHRRRDRFRANYIGYVFQQFNLIPYLDAVDNIKLANHFSRQRAKNASSDQINALLTSLNISSTDRHKPATALSIGQQQRVAIARALINKPQLLIADEPTSSLDSNNRDSFMSLLTPLVAEHNITLLFVSHDLSLSQYFDRTEALSEINCVREAG